LIAKHEYDLHTINNQHLRPVSSVGRASDF